MLQLLLFLLVGTGAIIILRSVNRPRLARLISIALSTVLVGLIALVAIGTLFGD